MTTLRHNPQERQPSEATKGLSGTVLEHIELARDMLRHAEANVHLREYADPSGATPAFERLTVETALNLTLARATIAEAFDILEEEVRPLDSG